MPSDPPLTDEEICRKFKITVDNPSFATAKGLSHSRHDKVICQVPDVQCPNCGHEFTATYYDLCMNEELNGDEMMGCEECDRWIYIWHIDTEEDEDFDPNCICVTLCTDSESWETMQAELETTE